MANYNLSHEADLDLEEIYEYSISAFGLKQANIYLNGITETLYLLAQNNLLGYSCDEIMPYLRRFDYKAHILFYQSLQADQIEIVRILHQNMDVTKHV